MSFKTCPKCHRQFNPAGVKPSEQDPRGWCWFCAQGIPLPPIASLGTPTQKKEEGA